MTTPHNVYLEIKQLLIDRSLSLCDIAHLTGVSKKTVNVIVNERYARQPKAKPLKTFSGPHVRCPTCGGMVKMPCLACQVRGIHK